MTQQFKIFLLLLFLGPVFSQATVTEEEVSESGRPQCFEPTDGPEDAVGDGPLEGTCSPHEEISWHGGIHYSLCCSVSSQGWCFNYCLVADIDLGLYYSGRPWGRRWFSHPQCIAVWSWRGGWYESCRRY